MEHEMKKSGLHQPSKTRDKVSADTGQNGSEAFILMKHGQIMPI
jgi:hypothetical protein